MMDAASAAKIMYADEIDKAEDVNAKISEKAAEYAQLSVQRRICSSKRLCGYNYQS